MKKKYSFLLFIALQLSTIHVSMAQSLFDAATFQPLISDQRAQHVGDILTIQVIEDANVSQLADTTAQKKGGMGFSFDANIPSLTSSRMAGLSDFFDGKGQVRRSGKMLAQISATVQEILPNGDLLIRGEQLIEINSERQQIAVEGRVRQRDIAENNMVLSNRIADAKISYIGDGVLGEKQTPGFLSRVLSWFKLL